MSGRLVMVTERDIPAIGALSGDTIIVRPAHAGSPVVVARGCDRDRLPNVLAALPNLTTVGDHAHMSAIEALESVGVGVRPRLTVVAGGGR